MSVSYHMPSRSGVPGMVAVTRIKLVKVYRFSKEDVSSGSPTQPTIPRFTDGCCRPESTVCEVSCSADVPRVTNISYMCTHLQGCLINRYIFRPRRDTVLNDTNKMTDSWRRRNLKLTHWSRLKRRNVEMVSGAFITGMPFFSPSCGLVRSF